MIYTIILSLFCAFSTVSLEAMSVMYKEKQLPVDQWNLHLASENSIQQSNHFNPKLIKKPVYQELVIAEVKAERMQIQSVNGHPLDVIFVNRNSDKVLIVGAGFKEPKERLLVPYVKLFPEYDLVFFDFSAPYREGSLQTYCYNRWGTLEVYFIEAQKDVRALTSYIRSQKNYKVVCGVGLCYSGIVFAGAQASNKNGPLFDKLVVDSSYYSLADLARRVLGDPKLACDHRTGGSPAYVQWMLSSWPVRYTAHALGYLALGSSYSALTSAQIIGQLNNAMPAPLFLIHAEHDRLVPVEALAKMYAAAPVENTVAIAMPSYHARNHLECSDAFSVLVKQFVESPTVEKFVETVTQKPQPSS